MILKVNARPPHVVGLCFFVFLAANEVFVEPIETQDLEEFAQFLRDLFSIISELRRNVYSSCDTQILEQMYSRSLATYEVVINFELQIASADSISNGPLRDLLLTEIRPIIYQLLEKIDSYRTRYEERTSWLHVQQLNNNLSYVNRVPTGMQGRPKHTVSEHQVLSLRDIGFSWIEIANMIGISPRTLRRRRIEFGWPMGRSCFTDISEQNLDAEIRGIMETCPNAGERMVIGALRSKGIFVQRVDPIGRQIRGMRRSIRRRVYSVPCPYALW